MKVNTRKPIRLKNTTKYWNPETCKSHVQFSSPDSYQSFKIKQDGYETRLYWQFKYCEDHEGQTFFYTLTYNDANIPKYLGHNCFDYEDLRDLLTGGFRKILLRKFGTTFKYFIGAELGDGKGERGFHNNPHYHVLFFLEPASEESRPFKCVREKYEVGVFKRSSKYHKKGDVKYSFRTVKKRVPYVPISPVYFRHLVRKYWQGFDEDVDGFRDYRTARYGIATEGLNVGKVTDFRACVYCAKYVSKDAGLKLLENDVEKSIRLRLRSELRFSVEFNNYFFDNVIMPFYLSSFNPKKQLKDWQNHDTPDYNPVDKCPVWSSTRTAAIDKLLPGVFDSFDFITNNLSAPVFEFCRQYDYWKFYNESFKEYLENKVKEAVNEYRNRYCNKPRISHGVGDYALDFIDDKNNPLIQVPSKDGFKNRPLNMYYYRKMFTEVHIDKKGSPIRVLNDDGIAYKVSRLQQSIDKMSEKAGSNMSLILQNKDLFEKMRSSDVNTDVCFHYNDFLRYYERLCAESSLAEIVKRYSVFKLVYEYRFFAYDFDGNNQSSGFPDLSLLDDYRRFLQPSYFSVSRSDIRLDLFLENNCPDCLPYSQHPYFLRYLGIFRVLDLCADYFFIQDDLRKQKEAEDIAAVKRFHDKQKLKAFYAGLTL